MANGAFIPSLDAMTQRPAYGGVRQIRMTAPSGSRPGHGSG